MSEELKRRTKAYALRVMRLCDAIPNTPAGRVIRGQLLRVGTSVGANYRTACRAKSPAQNGPNRHYPLNSAFRILHSAILTTF